MKTTGKVFAVISILVILSMLLGACAPAAVEKKTVKISWIGPMTGGNAGPGLGGKNSFQLAVDQRNADTSSKYKYEAVFIDDECKPDVAVQAALKAASDSAVVASISHYCSMTAISTTDTFHNAGLPSIVWGAVLPAITYDNEYPEIMRVNGTQIQQSDVHAKDMWDLGYRTVSIIFDTSDYGRGHLQFFKAAWLKIGGKVLSEQGVTTDQQDFTAELTKVKAEDPDAIFFGGLAPLGIPLRKQMVKLGLKMSFEGTSGIKNESFNTALGADAEGCVSYLEGAPLEDLPGGKQFQDAYTKASFKEPPEAYGAFAYAATVLALNAVEKVGPDRKLVTDELVKTSNVDSIIGKITFDNYGQNVVPLVTEYVSQNGKWVPLKTSEYAPGGTRTLPGVLYLKNRGK
jgi:branched-chain amino acid transport system substrate-binding protein